MGLHADDKEQVVSNGECAAAPLRKGGEAEFSIAVVGPVSAGKSTLLNALLGRQLLSAGNEATTASHIRVRHRPRSSRDITGAFNAAGNLVDLQRGIGAEMLRALNARPDVTRIHVAGDLGHVAGLRQRVDLHDLPGINNSNDSSHRSIAFNTLASVRWSVLLVVLDATALATTDEESLLESVQKVVELYPERQVIFALNKVDQLDADCDSPLPVIVNATRARLQRMGFASPWVMPIMARTAMVARLQMRRQPISSRQKMELENLAPSLPELGRVLFESSHMPQVEANRLVPEINSLQHAASLGGWASSNSSLVLPTYAAIASGVRALEGVLEHCLRASRKP